MSDPKHLAKCWKKLMQSGFICRETAVDVPLNVFIPDEVIRCKQKGQPGKCCGYSVFIFLWLLFNNLAA